MNADEDKQALDLTPGIWIRGGRIELYDDGEDFLQRAGFHPVGGARPAKPEGGHRGRDRRRGRDAGDEEGRPASRLADDAWHGQRGRKFDEGGGRRKRRGERSLRCPHQPGSLTLGRWWHGFAMSPLLMR